MNIPVLKKSHKISYVYAVVIAVAIGATGLIGGFAVGWFFGPIPEGSVKFVKETNAESKEVEKITRWYTCSMHPSVRKSNPNDKCPICGMDLIPLDNSMGGEGTERILVMNEASIKLAEIQTSSVQRFFPTHEVRLFGTIDYDEKLITTITAYYPGRLERLYVDYTGVHVNKGDHVADIYSEQLITTHEELRLALDALKSAEGGSELVQRFNRNTLKAAREKLRLWGLTEEQIKEFEESEEIADRVTIYSPMTGIVIHKKAVEGMYVKKGDPIYIVADLDHLWVQLEAYESQLPWIRFGMEVTFTTDSNPGDEFKGRIAFINPSVNPKTRTVRVRVNIENFDRRLKPGMFVHAIARSRIAGHGMLIADELAGKWIGPMHTEVIKDGPGQCDICGMDLVPIEELGYHAESDDIEAPLVIPASSVLITGKRAVAYVRLPNKEKPTFEYRNIVLGPRAGNYYIVKEGLAEGEEIVTNGAFKIDSSMQIANKFSMMNPATPDTNDEVVASETQPDASLREEFIISLKPVYAAYFVSQEALAADNLDVFKTASSDMHNALEFVDTTGITGEPLGQWRRFSTSLLTDAEHIGHLADLEAARTLFNKYSTVIIDMDKQFGHRGSKVHYVSYCPMAFGDTGANWLSRKKEINNPYLGEMMLDCGEVQQEIHPLDHMEGDE